MPTGVTGVYTTERAREKEKGDSIPLRERETDRQTDRHRERVPWRSQKNQSREQKCERHEKHYTQATTKVHHTTKGERQTGKPFKTVPKIE